MGYKFCAPNCKTGYVATEIIQTADNGEENVNGREKKELNNWRDIVHFQIPK